MGAVCAVIISTVSIYGVLSAGNIHTTKYNISVDKKAGNMKELNVVLVADLHLGYKYWMQADGADDREDQ